MNKLTFPPHVFRQLVNDLRDIPNIGAKRELIAKKLKSYGIEPEQPQRRIINNG